MIMSIYRKALNVILKKPLQLWGISLLAMLLISVMSVLFGAVIGIALAIDLAILTALTIVFLRGYRGETPRAVDLFVCLKDMATAKRVIGGMAWMVLWVFLWSLIPVVGPIFAIIKFYSYRLTPYILVQEPEVPATEAFKLSEQRTKGYRLNMFLADFLVGAAIFVVVFVVDLVLVLLGLIPYVGFIFAALAVIFTLIVTAIVYALVPLFLGLVQAAFYEEIMAKNNQ